MKPDAFTREMMEKLSKIPEMTPDERARQGFWYSFHNLKIERPSLKASSMLLNLRNCGFFFPPDMDEEARRVDAEEAMEQQ
ncbi:MAG: hypothetical protein H6922_04070 [Pseudomonadaceae bacterium]|nr:hypothetical protein [Pseudomonadaceae bacterium]